MEKYDPKRMELSTRDVVARSIYTEVKEGRGTEHGGAYLDISHKPAEYVKKKLPSMYHQFKELADVDITKGPMEVGPTCHYVMGGIRVEAETAQSTLPGLFAAGEAAAGLHGANRSGRQFAFRSAGVWAPRGFGGGEARQGSFGASDRCRRRSTPRRSTRLRRSSGQGGENPYAIHRDLQTTMQSLVGIFRTREDVQKALVELGQAQRALDAHQRGRLADVQSRLASGAGSEVDADDFGSGGARARWCAKRAAGRTAASIFRS